MAHTTKHKHKLLMRIRRIKGQAEALEKALEKEVECSCILQQIAAVRGAVNGLMAEVVEGYIREHLGEDIPLAQRKEDMEQIVPVIRAYLK